MLGTTMARHTLLDYWRQVCCPFLNLNKERQVIHMNRAILSLI